MRYCRKVISASIVSLILVGGGAERAAFGQVLRPANSGAPLAERFAAAMGEGIKTGGPAFWVGYSIKRLMGERSYIGSWGSSGRSDERTLEEILEGRGTTIGSPANRDAAVKDAARRALNDIERSGESERLVLKDIGILFQFPAQPGKAPEDIRTSDLKLNAKLGGHPLVWLGPVSDAESLNLLTSMFDRSGGAMPKVREKLIHAVALHRSPDAVVPFLARVLSGSGEEKVLRAAAFGLGEQDDPRAVASLGQTLKSAAPLQVKKAVIWGLAENKQLSSLDALIAATSANAEKAVRKEAVMGLAEKASEKAVRTLELLAFDDQDSEVQKRALYALAEQPEAEAAPFLIRVAKTHHNPEVRRAAIFALGDLGSAQAVAALVEIAKGRTR